MNITEFPINDLPTELVEHILVKAVVLEATESFMVKPAWKMICDQAIRHLSAVCVYWSNILQSEIFANKVHRNLETTRQRPMRLDILKQFPVTQFALDITTLQDEMFLLWRKDAFDYSIDVYSSSDDFNSIKEVIPLKGKNPRNLESCHVSNCLYFIDAKKMSEVELLRIEKNDAHQFVVVDMFSFSILPNPSLSVTNTGTLILSGQQPNRPPFIRILNPDGTSQQSFRLRSMTPYVSHIVEKSNGNLVLVSHTTQVKFTEVDRQGNVISTFKPSDIGREVTACKANVVGNVLLTERHPNRIILLDSEFQLHDITGPQVNELNMLAPLIWHYNVSRNEMVAMLDTTTRMVSVIGFVNA